MRVEVERDMCIGAGMCTLLAAEVFDQNDDEGVVVLLDERPPAHLHEAVREAVNRCPAAVIRVYERE
jgi:ferredoxin